jgi:hypothetical protein
MNDQTLVVLQARRDEIGAELIRLLRLERGNTALSRSETLAYLVGGTLDAVFSRLRRGRSRSSYGQPQCQCGRNPYVRYYVAARQALLGALIDIQYSRPDLAAFQRSDDIAQLDEAVCAVIGEYSEGFASLCQHCSTREI